MFMYNKFYNIAYELLNSSRECESYRWIFDPKKYRHTIYTSLTGDSLFNF